MSADCRESFLHFQPETLSDLGTSTRQKVGVNPRKVVLRSRTDSDSHRLALAWARPRFQIS
jgi:hypothetical protein